MALDDALLPLQRHDPRKIGPYRVVGRLGEGGMGVVYAARRSGTRAALKLIRPEYAADAQFRERFRREVALLSRVEGACVAQFLAADTETARPWLATSYVPGPTLNAHIGRTGPLHGTALLSVAAGVAEALAVIHRAGVIHRDLKPGNVILSPDGPKVLDFGIARALDETAITVTHVFVGSSGWASPEQYRGGEIGPAGDVYGWGAVIAFAATGRPPLGTGSIEVMAHRVLKEEPNLDGIHDPLRSLVSSALAKDPADRPTVQELIEALAELGEVPADDATQVATTILETGWEPLARALPATVSWSRAPRFSRRTAAIGGVAAAAVLASTAAAVVMVNRPAKTALPRSTSHRLLINADSPSLTPPASLATSTTPRASVTSADPIPTFSPPSSWQPEDLSGIVFYAPGDWNNGFPDLSPSDSPDFLCLLPPTVTPAGMAMCRGALTFSLGPTKLDSEADWRRQIGASVGWANTSNVDAGSIPGTFTRAGTAYVGSHKALYREFLSTDSDGTQMKFRVWWLPVTKLWIYSALDSRYDTVVDHMLATFDFTGFQQPSG
ncbi:serine/threonine-protein kinase [Actinoallomurus rhizosphaericola]|uniref:serine/threonine-protein kinase n=1 Tax=Actinoallomurus rhizosphaericola TaxID=2952536 RepID=UPI002093D590|nr:serine/threonine-protein kinase [Actinoallomurus rhizosphaericola]MCO5998491.1 serine/threonine protein kinase [Actinoallomurus rhizosphaericola]